MAKVKNLSIKLQSGTDSTYYATWEFDDETKNPSTGGSTSGGTVKKGDLVSIKPGATYYNGVSIPTWVMNDKWYVSQLSGDRAVLGKNQSGTNNIVSPIKVSNLIGGTGASAKAASSSDVSEETLDYYEVKWAYDTGDSVWFSGGTTNETEKLSTYSGPSNAIKLKITVKPVSKTHKVNNKDTSYWTGTAVSAEYAIEANPPVTPSTPTIKVEKYQLTASIENIADPRTDQIQFQVYNGTAVANTGTATVEACMASFVCAISSGGEYRVRCRAINLNGTAKIYSEWSSFTSAVSSIPSAPSGITEIRATSETSVYLEWPEISTAKTYDIEYTTKKQYFDGSDQTTTISGIEFNHYEKTGLEGGEEYFFRVRAVNENGESAWSEITSVVVGKDPAAPTTWSSTTTAITGESVTLYWVHNSEDGSSQTYADLELYINGQKETHTISNDTTNEDEKDKTSSYVLDTSSFIEGTTIEWRVRTSGITKAYGDWSIMRTIKVYAPPTLQLNVTKEDGTAIETLDAFPFYVYGLAGPDTQLPIGYHLSITSNEVYETVDNVGNPKFVNVGDTVYSKYFDIRESLLVEFSANNIDLQNGVEYTVVCTVAMDSGLTTESSTTFDVSWTDELVEPDAAIAVDTDSYVAYVRPYCLDSENNFVEGVKLSVYRREFDGGFTELATGIDNMSNTIVTDPHPALDYARYRIVAVTDSTGAVSYYDPPGYPMGGKSIIIQWDEMWSNFETTNSDALEQPPWEGSLLTLPYNVDVSDNNRSDVTLVEYIGRAHPVTYYGTQLGETATWNTVIRRDDEETLYALRRLAKWMGDVYVREPSGSGYWANVSVSISQKHRDLTIPVTLNITRVEGGV